NWQAMKSLPRNDNYWIYFSPDNLHAALVNSINQEIIFISERSTGAEIYKSRNARKHAQFFYAMKQPPFRAPERVI
ncbi:unnamed protein product, partial [marine sediment metagenome]